jgi:uncharacterized protein
LRAHLFFVKQDKIAAEIVKAVIERQALCIAADPYTNSFRENYKTLERKFELDSLCYPVLLIWTYWKMTGDDAVFTPAVKKSFELILQTMETEQDHDGNSSYKRNNHPVKNTGMIWSAYRPSDDACKYNFLIPSQMQAVQALTALTEIENFLGNTADAGRAQKLGAEVHDGIQKYGIVDHPKYGKIYAYETDGLGHHLLMDDANLPSLLSAPYFGYLDKRDPVYTATRRFILSNDNPYFYSGKLGEMEISGVGSPHTEPNLAWSIFHVAHMKGKTLSEKAHTVKSFFRNVGRKTEKKQGLIWPLAQLAQGLTAVHHDEQIKMLKMLLASDTGDHSLHESYLPQNPKLYSRKDFGWPNALFAEFIMTEFQGRQPLPVPPAPGDKPSAPRVAPLRRKKPKIPPLY